MKFKSLHIVCAKLFICFILVSVFLGGANITGAHILKYLLNDLIISQNSIHTVAWGLCAFLCYYFLNNVAWRIYLLIKCKIDLAIKKSVLKDSFSEVIHNSFRFFQNNSSSVISNNIRSFINDISYFTNSFGQLAIVFFTILFSIISLFIVNVFFGLVLLVWVPCFCFSYWKTAKKIRILGSAVTKELSDIVDTVSNVLDNNFYVHITSSYDAETARIFNLYPKFAEKYQLKEVSIIKSGFFQGLAVTALLICMLILLFKLKQEGVVTVGDFALIIGLSSQVAEQTWRLVELVYSLNDLIGAFEEYAASIKDTISEHPIENSNFTNGDIEFHDVSYKNGQQTIIAGLSLAIKQGSKVALIGPSGIGKTTFSLLLLKLISPTDGYITIGENDIACIKKNSLRHNISAMSQQNILYNRSVLENIRYGNNASFAEIERIMKILRLDKRISKMPFKYDTLINDEALSGGEKQRILIARTVLRKASIYIFDECTSQLDSENEHAAMQLILEKCSSKTVIFITHKASILKYVDETITIQS